VYILRIEPWKNCLEPASADNWQINQLPTTVKPHDEDIDEEGG
jgi:hypothetical protein